MRGLKVQEIQVGTERAVIVPLAMWKRVIALLEELEDVALYDQAKADGNDESVDYVAVCRDLGLGASQN